MLPNNAKKERERADVRLGLKQKRIYASSTRSDSSACGRSASRSITAPDASLTVTRPKIEANALARVTSATSCEIWPAFCNSSANCYGAIP